MTAQTKLRLIEQARRRGMTNAEVLHTVLQGEFGNRRREIVVEWSEVLGLSPTDALRLAYAAGLLPSAHPPRTKEREKPHGKGRGSIPEKT